MQASPSSPLSSSEPEPNVGASLGFGPVPAEAFVGAGEGSESSAFPIDAVMRIPVLLQVILGSTSIPVASLLRLGRGAVIALDHRVGEPVDVVVNGRVIARGEVVVVDEGSSRFGVSLTEIINPPPKEPA